MKIRRLWKAGEFDVLPAYGNAAKLCELIKQPGYYFSKTDANLDLKLRIIYKSLIKQ